MTIEQIAWTIEKAERSTRTGSRPRRQQIIAQAIIDNVLPSVKAQAWAEGYAAGRFDSVDSLLGDNPTRKNPYREEN